MECDQGRLKLNMNKAREEKEGDIQIFGTVSKD